MDRDNKIMAEAQREMKKLKEKWKKFSAQ